MGVRFPHAGPINGVLSVMVALDPVKIRARDRYS